MKATERSCGNARRNVVASLIPKLFTNAIDHLRPAITHRSMTTEKSEVAQVKDYKFSWQWLARCVTCFMRTVCCHISYKRERKEESMIW